MILDYKEYTIEVVSDEMYSLKSTDNKIIYEKQYYPYAIDESNTRISKYGILKKNKNDEVIESAIVLSGGGGISSPQEDSVLIDEDHLVFLIGNSIFCLLLTSLDLVWKVTNEGTGVCFELAKVFDGYIVRGELSIFKVNYNGDIEWDFWGKDIFVSPDGRDDFIIENDLIIVKDWNNNTYKISLDGKEVK